MKKIIFALVLLPFFASAQNYNESTEGVYQSQAEQQQEQVVTGSDMDVMSGWRKVRCGAHSESKCQGRNVYDTCERDGSHGIYGSCRNYGQRGPEVVCGCL